MITSLLSECARAVRRRPGPVIASIMALTFSIALFAAIISVLQAFLFRPSMVHDIDRVVRVRERISASASSALLNMSPQVFEAWRHAQTVFEDMAAATNQNVALRGNDTSDSVAAGMVSSNFFHVLGITPQLGRDFADGEDLSGRDGVVLLGDGVWRNRYNADPNILGRQLTIDGQLRTVIGVMPPRLMHPYGAELWLPLRMDEMLRQVHGNFLYAPARLRDGIDLASAQAGLSALAASIHQTQPTLDRADAASLSGVRDEGVRDLRPTLWLLFASALFVVLIATLNTATLFYAQGIAEAQSTLVRLALGASRAALFRRALVRSGLVVGTALVLALIVAPHLYEPLFGLSGGASIREFDSVARLDLPTAAWISLIAVLVALGLALLDVRQAFAAAPALDSRTRGATIDRTMRRRLYAATVAQCALSFTLAATALLVTMSYTRLLNMDRGFDSQHLKVGDLAFPATRYPTPASRDALVTRLLAALRALPGVQAAGGSTVTPDYGGDWGASFVVPGRAPLPDPGFESTNHRLVTPDYLDTMRIPLLAGQGFDRANPARDVDAVIVSHSFAEHTWPHEDAVGKTLDRLGSQRQRIAQLHVIGVAADVVEAVRDPDTPAARSWYMSTTAGSVYDYAAISVAVRADALSPQLTADIQRALAQIDPELAWWNLAPMQTRLTENVSREQLSSFLFATFAACSLLIALGGLYAALGFLVETSRREFGIRLALGALSRQVLSGLLLRAIGLAASGVVLGALLALPLIRIVGAYVYGASFGDAWTMLPLGIGMLALALLAGFVPARRAAHTDPIVALRHE
ncbi:MAG: ABC transporter permease [Dokdonella sp.]